MAKEGQFRQNAGEDLEKKATTDISLPDTGPRALARRKTGNRSALSSNPEGGAAVRKRADYAREPSAVARKAPKTSTPAVGGSMGNSIPVQTGNSSSSTVQNGSSSRKNMWPIAALSFSCFLVIFVLLFCIVPLKKVSYEVPVVYQDVETYIEQEPYLETVYYSEKEPYTVTEAYTVSQPYTVIEPYILYNPWPVPTPRPGPQPPSDNRTRPHPLPPPPQPTVSYREVTRYMDVTKYRDVVQYKDVQKSKNEIRFRPVQKQRPVLKVRQEIRYKMVPLLYYEVS